MGLCEENCLSEDTGINFATVNLLTVDECEYLFKVSQIKEIIKGPPPIFLEIKFV